jgi:hypothetical protein
VGGGLKVDAAGSIPEAIAIKSLGSAIVPSRRDRGPARLDGKEARVNLGEYLMAQPGRYVLAESHAPLAPESVADELLEEEVEVYLHGQDAAGRASVSSDN